MEFTTDFLYASPSFASGVARLVDLFGTFDEYNRSLTTQLADARAVYADWGMVGRDLTNAMTQYQTDSGAASPQP